MTQEAMREVPADAGATGLRSRLARLTGSRTGPSELDPLIRTLRQYHPKSDVRMLQRAYETAAYLHRDQKRRSGDPYITHPLAVATILFLRNDREHEWRWYQAQFKQQVGEKFGADLARTVPSGMQQIWVPALGRADRCTTCHQG